MLHLPSSLRAALPALLILLLSSINSLSAQPPQGELRVARLIRHLGSTRYDQRQQASDELARLGLEAQSLLEKAARSEDPEIRLRALELLKRLKIAQLWEAPAVKTQCQERKASEMVAELAEQTGNRLLVGDQYGTFQDAAVTLEHPQGTFWSVLDDLCRQSKNHVRSHYDTRNPGLVVVTGGPGKYPVAYAGPVRGQINSARRVFREDLDYEDLTSDKSHTFQLHLQMMWEDRFRLVAYRSHPELTEAVTDTGLQLAATQPAGSGWNVANQGTHLVTMELRLHPPATSARQLDTLRLKWGLIAVGDMATIEVDDLASKAPHFQDDVQLLVESVEQSAGGRYEVIVTVNRDLIIPEPQEILFQENDLQLLDAEGRPFRRQGQSNSLTDRGARIKVSFAGESSDSTPARLRLEYPRIRAQHDLEILFRNVPLPVARPE